MTSIRRRVAPITALLVRPGRARVHLVLAMATLVLTAVTSTSAQGLQPRDSLGALRKNGTDAAPAMPKLVLGALYREARLANPRVKAARALARAAGSRVTTSKRPPDPEVQVGFMNYRLRDLKPMEPLGMTQLQLMQMVPTGGKLALAGRAAEARAAAEENRATEVWWQVRSDVAMTFYDLYETEQALAVARRTLRLVQDIAEMAQAMYRVGEGRQADVLRANVEIARMIEDTIRMTAMRDAMAARLDALLDRRDDSVLAAPALPEFPASVPPLDVFLAQALEGRAMVQAGEHDVEAAVSQVKLARREIWPDLTIGVQYGWSRRTMPGGIGENGMPVPDERGTEHMGSLMLGTTIPIFARSRQLRMREEMAAMQQMAEAELAEMRAATRGQVARVHADLLRARRLATLYRTTVIPQAEAAVRSAQTAYRVGGVDFMTLLDNQRTVNRYEQELFVLESEHGKAWAELEMLLGRELFNADILAASVESGGGQ